MQLIQGVAVFVVGIVAAAAFSSWMFEPPTSTMMSTLLGMPVGFASVMVAMRRG